MKESFELFVTCSSSLEPLLVNELLELGFTNPKEGFRGVFVDTDMRGIYRINYASRLAGRVLLPIHNFRCYDQKGLYRGAGDIDWLKYIPSGKSFAIDCNGRHPQLSHTLFAAQVVKDAICDQFRAKTGNRPSVNTAAPDVQINLFLTRDSAFISIDTSGAPLFKRGYRREASIAPMQESLAAAILKIAGYQSDVQFLDPCCGSGTFLIEAAYAASKTPAGFLRNSWGFFHLPLFCQEEWEEVKLQENAKKIPLSKGKIEGIEVNKEALRICKANLRSAGFFQEINVIQGDFREVELRVRPNFIVCNPPHGNRLGDVEELRSLYSSLGDFLKRRSALPAKGFIFTSSLELSKEIGLKPLKRHVIEASGLDSRLLEFEIY